MSVYLSVNQSLTSTNHSASSVDCFTTKCNKRDEVFTNATSYSGDTANTTNSASNWSPPPRCLCNPIITINIRLNYGIINF